AHKHPLVASGAKQRGPRGGKKGRGGRAAPPPTERTMTPDLIRRLTGHRPDLARQTDGQLLRRFLARHDEAAFAELLRRHGPTALGPCRRLLHRVPDVEDAFQATFLVLVRRAAALTGRASVGGWVYRVAFHAALKVRTAERLRRLKEREAAGLRTEVMAAPEAGDW